MSKVLLKTFLVSIFILGFTVSVYGQPVLNPANGHYYELGYDDWGLTTWNIANAAASASIYNGMRGHLATITSDTEEAFITSTFSAIVGVQHVWLGGFQSPSAAEPFSGWQWITDETWAYTNWDGGEPNNSGDEDCLEYTDGVAAWNDESCNSEIFYYLIEYEPSAIGSVYYFSCPLGNCPTSMCNIFTPGVMGCFDIGQLSYCGCSLPCPPSSCAVFIPTL